MRRREAVSSSAIEGTYASIDELFRLKADERSAAPSPDTREVRNYVVALDHGVKRLDELPICLRLMRELHERLMRGVTPAHGGRLAPGEFRQSQNWIGDPSSTVATARFVPPPPNEVMPALDELERYINDLAPPSLPRLVRVALVHYQFETIHPFADGNGRVGRLLIPLMLARIDAHRHPLLFMAPYFEHHRDEYIDRMYNASLAGAWRPWLDFFLRGVIEEASDAIGRIRTLNEVLSEFRSRLKNVGAKANTLLMVDRLLEMPYFTIPAIQAAIRVSYPTAKWIAQMLVLVGIAKEVEGSRPRLFVASDIMSVLNRPFEPRSGPG